MEVSEMENLFGDIIEIVDGDETGIYNFDFYTDGGLKNGELTFVISSDLNYSKNLAIQMASHYLLTSNNKVHVYTSDYQDIYFSFLTRPAGISKYEWNNVDSILIKDLDSKHYIDRIIINSSDINFEDEMEKFDNENNESDLILLELSKNDSSKTNFNIIKKIKEYVKTKNIKAIVYTEHKENLFADVELTDYYLRVSANTDGYNIPENIICNIRLLNSIKIDEEKEFDLLYKVQNQTFINIIDESKDCDESYIKESKEYDVSNKTMDKIIYELKMNPKIFVSFSETLRNDRDIIKLVLGYPRYEVFPNQYDKVKKEWVMPNIFDYVHKNYQYDREIILLAISNDADSIKDIDKSIFDDPEFAKECIIKNGEVLNYLPAKYRIDKEFALLAYTNSEFVPNLLHLGPNIRNSKKIIIEVVKKNGVINYISNRLRNNYDLAKWIITISTKNFKYLGEDLRKNYDLCYFALSSAKDNDDNIFSYILNEDILDNKKFLLKLIDDNKIYIAPSDIKFVSDRLKGDIEFVKKVFKNAKNFYSDIKKEKSIDDMNLEELYLAGLELSNYPWNDCFNADCFCEKLRNDAKFMYKVIKKDTHAIHCLGNKLNDNEEFLMKLMEDNMLYDFDLCQINNKSKIPKSKEFLDKYKKKYPTFFIKYINNYKNKLSKEDIEIYFHEDQSITLEYGCDYLFDIDAITSTFRKLYHIKNKKYDTIESLYEAAMESLKYQDKFFIERFFSKIPKKIKANTTILTIYLNSAYNLNIDSYNRSIIELLNIFIKNADKDEFASHGDFIFDYIDDDVIENRDFILNVIKAYDYIHNDFIMSKILEKYINDEEIMLEILSKRLIKNNINKINCNLIKDDKFLFKYLDRLKLEEAKYNSIMRDGIEFTDIIMDFYDDSDFDDSDVTEEDYLL